MNVKDGLDLHKKSGIYSAIHRDTGRRYVGSSVDIAHRKRSHLRDALKMGSMNCFHRAIRKYGPEAFDFEVLEFCEKDRLLAREKYFIELFECVSEKGFNTLKNPYANYNPAWTDVSRARLSAAHRGKRLGWVMPEEVKARIGASNKGRVISPEMRAQISSTLTGRKDSEETRRRKATSLRDRWNNPEIRATMIRGKLGLRHTEKALENMRLAQAQRYKAKPMSQETKTKLSEIGRTRTFSAETRARLSAAQVLNSARRKEKQLAALNECLYKIISAGVSV